MTTTTTNYGWVKPDVGASDDVWGGYINTDLDGIDAIVKGVSVVANAAYPASNPSGYQTAAQVASVVIGDNRIINGDMRIDQRNGGASGTAGGYTVDRWQFAATQASKGTWQRQTGGPTTLATGFGYFLSFTSSSAFTPATADWFAFLQRIEADMVSDFAWGTANAQPVSLSFWVQSSLTGTFSGAIRNDVNTRSYPFSYSIPVAGAWTKIAITIPGDTAGTWVMAGNGSGVQVSFDLGSGATLRGSAGAWATTSTPGFVGATGSVNVVGTNGATFYVTGVKLEIGSIATPFNRKSPQENLADCQRYFYKPLNLLSVGAGYASGAANSTIYITRTFPVTMRVPPTQSGATYGPSNCGAPGSGSINVDGCQFSAVNTAAGGFGFTVTAGTETYSAEL